MSLEIFDELFEHYGGPTHTSKFDDAELKALPSSLPEALKSYFKEYGRSQFYNGIMQTCHPKDLTGIIALIFGADKQINHKNCFPYAYTAFGELHCWVTEVGRCSIRVYDGEIYARGLTDGISADGSISGTIYTPFSLREALHDYMDIDAKYLFKRSIKKCGTLKIGECFGFVPALSLGGIPDIDSVQKLKANAHFAIVANATEYDLLKMEGYGNAVVVRAIG